VPTFGVILKVLIRRGHNFVYFWFLLVMPLKPKYNFAVFIFGTIDPTVNIAKIKPRQKYSLFSIHNGQRHAKRDLRTFHIV